MPLKELLIFRRHGKQYVPDLRTAELPAVFRGRPVINAGISGQEAEMVRQLCPVGAIDVEPCSIDLGKCLFCRECEWALPGKICFTNDHRIATNDRKSLVVKAGMDARIAIDPGKVRPDVQRLFRHALKLRQVSAGGDNSAEMELNAAGNVNFDMGRYGIEFVASPRHADGVVVTGPVSVGMVRALEITFEATPSPKLLILAGTDAISGGVFHDSPAVVRDFLERNPVDLFIPGNPPHPLTIINGLLDFTGRR